MGIERDEFYIGERVNFDAIVTPLDPLAELDPGDAVLIIQPPAAAAEATPAVTLSGVPLRNAHAEFVTELAGWHEWRWVTTGSIESARQGRFRVVPVNV